MRFERVSASLHWWIPRRSPAIASSGPASSSSKPCCTVAPERREPDFEAGIAVSQELEARGWRYCVIGGFAVHRWGEPRLTQDVHLTLLTGFGAELEFIDALLARFAPRIDDARAFAQRSRVLLLRADNGVPIDISLGAMPFEERAVERASQFDVGGESLLTCSAEDLVVFKAFAGRTRDWADIEGIVRRSGDDLDVGLILGELEPLLELKSDAESLPRLRQLLEIAG